MAFTYTTLSYPQKRDYIIKLLISFKDRGSTFVDLAEKIKNDTAYPEEKIDYIEARFSHYLDKTKEDKIKWFEERLHQNKPIEEATSDEELEAILSRL